VRPQKLILRYNLQAEPSAGDLCIILTYSAKCCAWFVNIFDAGVSIHSSSCFVMAVSCCQAPVPLQNERHPVRIEDVYVGGILWIRRQSSISSQFPDLALDPGSYNHPAIVIRLKKQDVSEPLVTIAPVSTQLTLFYLCHDQSQ